MSQQQKVYGDRYGILSPEAGFRIKASELKAQMKLRQAAQEIGNLREAYIIRQQTDPDFPVFQEGAEVRVESNSRLDTALRDAARLLFDVPAQEYLRVAATIKVYLRILEVARDDTFYMFSDMDLTIQRRAAVRSELDTRRLYWERKGILQFGAKLTNETPKRPRTKPAARSKDDNFEEIKALVLSLHDEGLSHRDICKRLGDSPRPPRSTWRTLPWPEAYRSQKFGGAVKKWLSKTISEGKT